MSSSSESPEKSDRLVTQARQGQHTLFRLQGLGQHYTRVLGEEKLLGPHRVRAQSLHHSHILLE